MSNRHWLGSVRLPFPARLGIVGLTGGLCRRVGAFRLAASSLVVILVATAVTAQTKDRLDRRDKLFGYEAVGLLEGPKGTCTAALIARDVVVTAAHCIHGKADEYVFRAAFRDDGALATRRVESFAIPKAYIEAEAADDRPGEVANDVALARLSSAIHDAGIDPYQIASAPAEGTELTLASYGQGRMGALQLERGCTLETRYRGGVVRIDCDATYGSSGAPVFVTVGGRPRVFSVVSSGVSAGTDGGQTLGVELSGLVPDLMEELRNKRSVTPVTTGARRITIGERSAGGARFVRPGGS